MARILVIDDEEIILRRMEKLLALDGYETFAAENGEAGLEIFKKEKPGLVLVDIKMPGMDGIKVLSEIKKISPETEVIVITGHGGIDTAIDALRQGAFDYITKPINYDELQIALKRALDKQNLLAENRRLLEEKVKAEAVKKSEAKFRSVSAVANDAIVIMDDKRCIAYWNKAAQQIFGYTEEEAVGKDLHNLLVPQGHHEAFAKGFAMFYETGQSPAIGKTIELTALRKSGDEFPIELSLAAMNIDDKWNGVGIVRDISKRKRAEEALRKSEESFQAVVFKNPSGIIVVDSKGIVLFVNPAAESLFNRNAKYIVGSVLGLPLVDGESTEIDIVLDGGKPGIAEMRVVETEWLGKPSYLATLFDITAIKTAEETLIRANKELVNLSQMKTEFISIASHELRTPLTSIKNAIDILSSQKAGELNEKQKQFIEMAARNIGRLAILINDLLDIAKLDAGKIKLDLAELDSASIFQKVVETFKPQADAKSQTLEIDYDGLNDVPTVYADYAKIEQVLDNLVSNALKFTQEGGKVILSARAISDFDSAIRNPQFAVEISVTDNGPGLSPDDQTRVFEKFYQAGNTLNDKSKGSGLGLNISKALVEAHGGQLLIESKPGKGCRFFFNLPIFSPEAVEMSLLEIEIRKHIASLPFSLLCIDLSGSVQLNKYPGEPKINTQFPAQLKDVVDRVIKRYPDRIIMQPHLGRLIIVLPGATKPNAMIVKKKLERAFHENPIFFDGGTWLPLSMIHMPVTFPEDGVTGEELIKNAGGDKRKR